MNRESSNKQDAVSTLCDKLQRNIFRSMTPAEKLDAALRLYEAAWDLKAAWVRQLDPSLNEEQVQAKVREIFLYART